MGRKKKCNPQIDRDALDFLDGMSMLDLRSIVPAITSSNRRKGLAHIKERLDKAIYNIEWRNLLPEVVFTVLTCPFRFHSMWLRDKK